MPVLAYEDSFLRTPAPRRAGCEAHKSGSVRAGGGQPPLATRLRFNVGLVLLCHKAPACGTTREHPGESTGNDKPNGGDGDRVVALRSDGDCPLGGNLWEGERV